MKKLLVLLLVFGLASAAGAVTSQLRISVNGELYPVDSEIWVLPSDTAVIDIWTSSPIAPLVGEGYFALTVETAEGSLSGGGPVVEGAGTDLTLYYPGEGYTPSPTDQGPWGGVAAGNINPYPAGTVLFDGIEFHCEDTGDAVIMLWDHMFSSAGATLSDSVIIHQIPEPMTIALLGLGGLFLVRRRK